MGIPRYLNGISPLVNPVISMILACVLLSTIAITIWDLLAFSTSPEHWEKCWDAPIRQVTLSTMALQNNNKSSAILRWAGFTLLHSGWNLNEWHFIATLIDLLRYSTIITNGSGDMGSPCLKPLSLGKNLKHSPFKEMLNFAKHTQVIILATNAAGNPRAFSNYSKNFQLTVSYDFFKSIFIIHHGVIFLLLYQSHKILTEHNVVHYRSPSYKSALV